MPELGTAMQAMQARRAARQAGSPLPRPGATTPRVPRVPGATTPASPTYSQPGTSPPGSQTTPVAGSLQGYTPSTPNAAVTTGAVNGIDPVKVTPTQLTGMQPFIDSAYQQSASRLDPQFQQAEARFQQDMVNKGIASGTDAYTNAYDDYSRQKNDAYATALNAAMGQGLAAQGQAWNQGSQQAQLAQAMRQWQDQFGLNRDQLDLTAQGQFTNQSMDAFKLNQASEQQKFLMAQAMLGMVPNQAPQPLDIYSPYQMQMQGATAQNANAANASNGFWGSVGDIGSAWATSYGS